MVARGSNFKPVEINLVGSSVFGRYPKISIEKTINLFQSDTFMVPYAGYKIAVDSIHFNNGLVGRGIFTSTKLNQLVVVVDDGVFLVTISFNQQSDNIEFESSIQIGALTTSVGVVYITENNRPQILISDNENLYIYNQSIDNVLHVVPNLNFTPGYITFHDSYFIAAASKDLTYGVLNPVNNTWRLSLQNQGYINPIDSTTAWPSTASYVGLLQTKPDNVQAVVRFPSKGNMIFVMGSIVTEAWFDTGAQLFPYQRNNQFNIDYGCLSPATVAYMDTIVVWLAQNEKSGPIIMYSDGGMPKKITTDGIDFFFSELQHPEDSQGYLYRQDGHLFYHINFYSDNISLFYDFNMDKFYHACDQNLNYFIASEISFYGNQYYFITRNNGNLFAFDTSFTTYEDVLYSGSTQKVINVIPRIRTCKNIRLPSQDYFIVNDVGFTIESGETEYFQQNATDEPIFVISQDGVFLDTQQGINVLAFFETQDNKLLTTQNDDFILWQQGVQISGSSLIYQQRDPIDILTNAVPAVDLSISYDGGASFSSEWRYLLPPIGKRKNRLMWWQCGIGNDVVLQFKFWSIGRAVFTEGQANLR